MAANYYDIATLKKIAEVSLIEQMNSANMLGMFLMADMQNAQELRLASKKLIIENVHEMVNCGDWKQVISHKPNLVLEILEGIGQSQRSNKKKN